MSVYYNEFDKKTAAWLRELIKQGHLPQGDVDERSIVDVQPGDLAGYKHCHFFAGIGGWPYALQLAGWDMDRPVWTGSCPCQPFSCAGKGLGTKDERHLWPEFFRLIAECRPATVFGEQVASKAGREWLAGVFTDLEGVGYAVAGADLCAAGVGAPHIRQRLYWVADLQCEGFQGWRSSECSEYKSNGQIRACRPVGGVADSRCATGEWNTGEILASKTEVCSSWQLDGYLPDGSQHGGSTRELPHAERRAAERHRHELASAARGVQGEACERERIRDDAGDVLLASGLPHTSSARSSELGRELHKPERPSTPSAWSDFDILPFRDGKQRRVESGTFPLAHGVPARVGRLRGYGNAIVPQVAAQFIIATQGGV